MRKALAVYPRWRGELAGHQCIAEHPRGLSPLARGTLQHFAASYSGGRFIPAGAGNSIPRTRLRTPVAVYPRWRGELRYSVRRVRILNGLSPLARGTRLNTTANGTVFRFIPAGAGNSYFYRSPGS